MRTYAFRLNKGQDLIKELKEFIFKKNIQAGVIITAVGCIDKVVIRMAGATPEKSDIRTYNEKLEIVSLVGTLSQEDAHIHIAVSNKEGEVVGGHLKGEAIIDTTVEIVIGDLEGIIFAREEDKRTGYKELKIVAK